MNDPRIKEAQQLFWQIETLRSLGVSHHERVMVAKLHRMAHLHEEIAKERLGRHDADGWIDLFAAITAWGEAGNEAAARNLLRLGEQAAQREAGREVLLAELGGLESWLEELPSLAAPEEAGRPRPRRPLRSLGAPRPREGASQ